MPNVRSVVRTLLAERVATGVAVLTLAGGIGAGTAVFTLISGIVLRPLPVAAPDRLARLYLGDPQEDAWAFRVWQEIDSRSEGVFAGAFASSRIPFEVGAAGESRFVGGPLGEQRPLRHARGAGGARPRLQPRGRPARVRRGGADVIGRQLPVNGITQMGSAQVTDVDALAASESRYFELPDFRRKTAFARNPYQPLRVRTGPQLPTPASSHRDNRAVPRKGNRAPEREQRPEPPSRCPSPHRPALPRPAHPHST